MPLASYSASADDSTAPPILELVSEVENLITLVPVAQRGLVFTAAVGINQKPGLDQFRNPTTNAAATIAVGGIYSNDNYAVITDFEDYFDGTE